MKRLGSKSALTVAVIVTGVGREEYYTSVPVSYDDVEESGLFPAVQAAVGEASDKLYRLLDGKKEDGTLDTANN